MSDRTAIEWTSATWNPTTGCDQVSEGCDHCYALTLAKRLKAAGNPRYQVDGNPRTSGPGFGLKLHEDKLEEPLKWKKPRLVFVNSMSDLFHKDVPDEFIGHVFSTMALAPQHTFQILTKRPGRMASLLNAAPDIYGPFDEGWPLPNVWLGASVETQKWADVRIPHLLRTPAAVRFLSCEPLLGSINLKPYLEGRETDRMPSEAGSRRPRMPVSSRPAIDWVIVGGESGPGARPMEVEWARVLRDQCVVTGVPYFFKQWGGRTPKAGGRHLDGREWDEMPLQEADLAPREERAAAAFGPR